MKKLISKFSDKLLSNASLRAVKGAGVPYCYCDGSPVDCPSGVSGGGDGCPKENGGPPNYKYKSQATPYGNKYIKYK